MKTLISFVLLGCATTTFVAALRSPSAGATVLDSHSLERLRAGSIVCAEEFGQSGTDGCAACLADGTRAVWFEGSEGGYWVNIDVWKQCNSAEPNEFCQSWVGLKRECDWTSNACYSTGPTGSDLYQDDDCMTPFGTETASCDRTFWFSYSWANPFLPCNNVLDGHIYPHP